MSYIIRNCPCLFNSYYASGKVVRFECNDGNHDDKLCRDVTDCVMKQIVKITKNYNKGCGKHCDINRKENNCGKTCNAYKIRQILELLDIQECE